MEDSMLTSECRLCDHVGPCPIAVINPVTQEIRGLCGVCVNVIDAMLHGQEPEEDPAQALWQAANSGTQEEKSCFEAKDVYDTADAVERFMNHG